MEKAGHESALPVTNVEEVVGGFEASFKGWQLEDVLHTAVVLRRMRTAARAGSTASGTVVQTVGGDARRGRALGGRDVEWRRGEKYLPGRCAHERIRVWRCWHCSSTW
jgi:hypothetical protein